MSSSDHTLIPVHIADLSPTEKASYTRILTCHPTVSSTGRDSLSFRARTTSLINRLPSRLRSTAYDTSTSSLPQSPKLCALHRPLNSHIIASARYFLETALDEQLPRILEHAGIHPRRPLAASTLTTDAQQCIHRSQDIMALVLTPSEFKTQYKRPAPPEFEFAHNSHVDHKCDACILAKIGSERDVLAVLGAIVLVRVQHRMANSSAWLEWLEGWNIVQLRKQPGEEFWQRSRRIVAQLLRPRYELSAPMPADGLECVQTFELGPGKSPVAAALAEPVFELAAERSPVELDAEEALLESGYSPVASLLDCYEAGSSSSDYLLPSSCFSPPSCVSPRASASESLGTSKSTSTRSDTTPDRHPSTSATSNSNSNSNSTGLYTYSIRPYDLPVSVYAGPACALQVGTPPPSPPPPIPE